MSNINLYQDEETSGKVVHAGLFDKGLIIGVIIFLVVLAGYGGLKMYLNSLDKEIENLQLEKTVSQNALNGKDVDLIASFQQRLDLMEAGKEVFVKNNPAGVFQAVQNAMIGGSVASEIGFQEKSLKVVLTADNFEILAKQILSFKKSSAFQNVEVKSSTLGDGGKVGAELAMTLNL